MTGTIRDSTYLMRCELLCEGSDQDKNRVICWIAYSCLRTALDSGESKRELEKANEWDVKPRDAHEAGPLQHHLDIAKFFSLDLFVPETIYSSMETCFCPVIDHWHTHSLTQTDRREKKMAVQMIMHHILGIFKLRCVASLCRMGGGVQWIELLCHPEVGYSVARPGWWSLFDWR